MKSLLFFLLFITFVNSEYCINQIERNHQEIYPLNTCLLDMYGNYIKVIRNNSNPNELLKQTYQNSECEGESTVTLFNKDKYMHTQ